MIDPRSFAPAYRHTWATLGPTVSQDACIFWILGSMIRDRAIIRTYSLPVVEFRIPFTRFRRVPSSWYGHGMNARNPFEPSGFLLWTSLIRTRWSKRSSIVSTWPNIMVALVVMPSLWASCITSSHSWPEHFPLEISLLTLSSSISAPAPGMESIPAFRSRERVSLYESLESFDIWTISGGPKACSLRVGYQLLSLAKVSS